MTEPLPGPDELIDKAAPQSVRYHDAIATIESALKLHEGEHALPRERAHYVGRALAAAGLLADPGLQADRRELADQLASANQHVEEQDARISQLEAEVVKQRIIAKNATDHWRQSSILARLHAANLSGRLELRKLNDAMTRKNRVIAKRVAERDQLRERKQADLDDLKKRLGIAQGTLHKHCVRRDEQDAEIERLRAERDILRIDFNSSEEDLTDARREIAEVRKYLIDNWYGGDPVDGTLMLLIGAVKQIQRERDERQGRIDAALALVTDHHSMEVQRVGIEAIRAALQGDQPTEPEEPHEDAYLFVRDDFGMWLVSATSTEDAITLFKRDRGEPFRGVFREVTPADPPSSPLPVSGEQEVEAKEPCPEGYHFVGQPLTHCCECGLPPWEHAGMSVLATDDPFAAEFVLRPWRLGERERLRAKWDQNPPVSGAPEEQQ